MIVIWTKICLKICKRSIFPKWAKMVLNWLNEPLGDRLNLTSCLSKSLLNLPSRIGLYQIRSIGWRRLKISKYNFRAVELSKSTITTNSVHLIESTLWSIESSRFLEKRLETASFSPTLYIHHHLRPFKTFEQPYTVSYQLSSLLNIFLSLHIFKL